MEPQMHNARVEQRGDGKFELLWADDEGNEQGAGPYDDPDEAAAELARRREALRLEAEAGEGG